MENLNQKLSLYKIPIALSVVGLVLIIGGIFSSGLLNFKPSIASSKSKTPYPSSSSSSFIVKVDLSGAVKNPGVYTLNKDSRVEDVLKMAGGFVKEASSQYISKQLNLSQKLTDGQKIYIPFQGEQGSAQLTSSGSSSSSTGSVTGKVGINSATSSELDTLPGVGSVTSGKIIAGRPYSDVLDLITKKVITKSVYDKIKDLVDLN